MQAKFILLSLSIVCLVNSLNALDLRERSLTDKAGAKSSQALAANDLQLINRNSSTLGFEYSLDKANWTPAKLDADKYFVVTLSNTENYYYVRLCTDKTGGSDPACTIYRLERQKRYEMKYDKDDGVYKIKYYQ